MRNLKRLSILFVCISFLAIVRAISAPENREQVELRKQLTRLNEKVASLEKEAGILEAMLNQQREGKPPSLVKGNESNWNKIIHVNLGFAYGIKGKTKEAIEEYKKALEYDPQDRDIHYNLGYLLAKNNRYKEAIEEYRKAIKGSPEDKEVYYNLAVIYATAIKDQKIANQYYQKSLNK